MTVRELIEELRKLKRPDLSVKVFDTFDDVFTNINKVEIDRTKELGEFVTFDTEI